MVEMEEKAGSLFEEGWFEALKADESTTRVIHLRGGA